MSLSYSTVLPGKGLACCGELWGTNASAKQSKAKRKRVKCWKCAQEKKQIAAAGGHASDARTTTPGVEKQWLHVNAQ